MGPCNRVLWESFTALSQIREVQFLEKINFLMFFWPKNEVHQSLDDQVTPQTPMKPINHHENRFPFVEDHVSTSFGLKSWSVVIYIAQSCDENSISNLGLKKKKKKRLRERPNWSELVTLSEDIQKFLLFFRWSIMIRAEFRYISRKLGSRSKKSRYRFL